MKGFGVVRAGIKLKVALVISVAAVIFGAALERSGVLDPYALKTLDLLFQQIPLPPASADVVLIQVAQPDLDFFKDRGITWPWPRQLYAPIIDFCRRGRAQAVIFDLLVTEASSYGPEDDDRLAQAMAASQNATLPFFLSRREAPPPPTEAQLLRKAALAIDGPAPSGVPAYRSCVPPIPPLLAAAHALGNVESRPDRDGIYRRVPLVVPYGDAWLPALALSAFHGALGGGPFRFEGHALVYGDLRLPLDGAGSLLLKFRGPSGSHRAFSAANVIQSEYLCGQGLPPIYPPEVLAGKWVVLGLTAPGLLDLKASPVDAVYPGAEIHATVLDNLLQRDFLLRLPPGIVWSWTLLLCLGVSAAVLFSPGILITLGLLVLLAGIHVSATGLAFWSSWYGEAVGPSISLAMSFALAAAYSYATEGRQKLAIRRMFSHYMSEALMDHLLRHPDGLKLGGERRRVTLFFSDLAQFTSICERLPPEEVVALLNDYLSRMTDIILEEQGTVDKFEGDAIMALWGAPLHQDDQAIRACRAALRQLAALADLNKDFVRKGLPSLQVRMGLHSGDAVVGNLGSLKRFDYTVIGDTVNLASRLEGLNKFYGTAILVSEATVAACSDGVIFREIDAVAVKGRGTPVRVFEPLALKGDPSEVEGWLKEMWEAGLARYREQRFAEAAEGFASILDRAPEDGPSRVFLDRCLRLEKGPPSSGWDAVFRPDTK